MAARVLEQNVGAAVRSERVPSGPGIGAEDAAVGLMVVPVISQIATRPSAFCNRMSEWPSPLKSPVPMAFQLAPGLATTALVVTLVPSISQTATAAVRVLQQNVGMAVVVEVTGSDRLPVRSRIAQDDAAGQSGPGHLPDRHGAIRVLQQNVGMAVVVEVAGSDHFPVRSWIGHDGARGDAGPVRFPDRDGAVRILQQDVRMRIVVEVTGSNVFPIRSRIGANALHGFSYADGKFTNLTSYPRV